MPRTPAVNPTTIADLHAYAQGVIVRARHHAKPVDEVMFIILGAMTCYADPASIKHMATVIWFSSRRTGNPYCVTTHHVGNGTVDKIEIRERTQKGPILHAFDNTDSAASVKAAFRAL
jgi:hypothetical protein